MVLIPIILLCALSYAAKVPWSQQDIKPGLTGLNNNDTLMVEAGSYSLTSVAWISGKQNIGVISKDGPGKVRITGPSTATGEEMLVFNACTGVYVEGLELSGGGDNNLKIGGCDNVIVRNCYIHDAQGQGDCIKVTRSGSTYSTNITVQNCIVHTPGMNSGAAAVEFEECLDFMYTQGALVQDCWFFHNDTLGNQFSYPKGDCSDIVYDRCVFGPQSSISWDPAVGGGAAGLDIPYNVQREVIRNCLFIDCHHGAIGSFGTRDFYIFNNTFINCGHRTRYSPSQLGIIHVKLSGSIQNNDNFKIYNNLFYNDQNKDVYIMVTQGANTSNILHDYNLYYNNGASMLASSIYDADDESFSVTSDPYADKSIQLPEIKITSSSTFDSFLLLKQAILQACRPGRQSAANDSGIDADSLPYPGVVKDIEGNDRVAGRYDIGAFENDGTVIGTGKMENGIPEICVFPNPSNSTFNLRLHCKMQNVKRKMQIYNILGQTVWSHPGNNWIWDTRNMPAGVYILKAVLGKRQFKKRIVLQK
jgi:hypothetical protein